MAVNLPLVPEAPAGFSYEPAFVLPDEERDLVEHIRALEFSDVRMRGVTARRRVRQFGWRYSFDTYRLTEAPPIPPFLEPLQRRAAALVRVNADTLSEALITEYRPGATIGWHRDAPMFGIVVGISLLSSCTFRFRRGPGTGDKPLSIVLAPRSVYVLDGEARRNWQHSIPATKELRYSVTFRTLRKARPHGRTDPRSS
jgi:alkylated DNA repair protein (DNA oxidative demethylase)